MQFLDDPFQEFRFGLIVPVGLADRAAARAEPRNATCPAGPCPARRSKDSRAKRRLESAGRDIPCRRCFRERAPSRRHKRRPTRRYRVSGWSTYPPDSHVNAAGANGLPSFFPFLHLHQAESLAAIACSRFAPGQYLPSSPKAKPRVASSCRRAGAARLPAPGSRRHPRRSKGCGRRRVRGRPDIPSRNRCAVDLQCVVGAGPCDAGGEQLRHAGFEVAAPARIFSRAA